MTVKAIDGVIVFDEALRPLGLIRVGGLIPRAIRVWGRDYAYRVHHFADYDVPTKSALYGHCVFAYDVDEFSTAKKEMAPHEVAFASKVRAAAMRKLEESRA